MSEVTIPRLRRWPFFVADGLLLALALQILLMAEVPLSAGMAVLSVICVTLAGSFGVFPFVREHWAAIRMAESNSLAHSVAELKSLKSLSQDIQQLTDRWQEIQDQSTQCLNTAREMSERMAKEAKDFTEFMNQASDQEKAHLRLDLEKRQRAESDWTQVITHILDHVFALHQAALRSGQPDLIRQLDGFQNACRDAARKVGLVPLVPAIGDPYDATIHHSIAPKENIPEESRIQEITATGYYYQSQLLRPAYVKLSKGAAPENEEAADTEEGASEQDQRGLPFENS